MDTAEPISIAYAFTFTDGAVTRITARLDPKTLALLRTTEPSRPDWTRLEAVGCPSCPLSRQGYTHCPVAVSLVELVEKFDDRVSYDKVALTVTTTQRTYQADATLQAGLSSLTGIYMVTSGCPVMDKLRPMVRFHLPLADRTETVYRAASMFLLAQLMRARRGLDADWSLKGLEKTYRAVHMVNVHIARAIRAAATKDANANALVRLDLFTEGGTFSIDDALADLEHLFEGAYLSDGAPGS
ncbi:MAG: hypothetical protein ACAI38_09895 [Myxococcota bacterium]